MSVKNHEYEVLHEVDVTGWQTQPDKLKAGFYQMRRVRHGPWIPVKIERTVSVPTSCNDPAGWRAFVAGELFTGDLYDLWVWCCGHPIPEKEYEFLLARMYHAKKWEPDSPYANPYQPVDWLTVKLPKGPK